MPKLMRPRGDEPFYGGSDTLLHQDDMTSYISASTMGSVTGSGTRRFAPKPSPVINSTSVDTATQALTTGRGGTGQALRLIYPANPGSQIDRSWDLINGPTVKATKEIYQRWYMRLSASSGMTTEAFAIKFMEWYYPSIGRVQVSTHNATPWDKGTNPDHGTYWQVYDSSAFTDDVHVFPTGHDQATQPFGPYFNAMVGDGLWHRIVVGIKDHTSSGQMDGFVRMWIDGIKIIDCCQAAVGITPSGGEKQWVGQDQVNAMTVAVDPRNYFTLGGVMTSVSLAMSVTLDVTEFLMWSRQGTPDIASSTFASGTASPYTLQGTAQSIVNDPTGAGRGKVYSNDYGASIGSASDINRYAQFIGTGPAAGQDVFFRGDVYFPSSLISRWTAAGSLLRKLTYLRDDVNGGTGQSDWVVGMWDDQLFLDFAVGSGAGGGGSVRNVATLSRDMWTTLEWRIRTNAGLNTNDGQWQVWVNGTSVLNQSGLNLNTKGNSGQWVWFTCGHQREGNAADTGSDFEMRYWDRVAFSTERIGT